MRTVEEVQDYLDMYLNWMDFTPKSAYDKGMVRGWENALTWMLMQDEHDTVFVNACTKCTKRFNTFTPEELVCRKCTNGSSDGNAQATKH